MGSEMCIRDSMINRQVQKDETFTGITGVNIQDRAIQESMGRIVDRTKEFLGPSDMAIVATWRSLEEVAGIALDVGDPPGIAPTYYNIRATEGVVANELDWREALMDRMYPDTPAATIK